MNSPRNRNQLPDDHTSIKKGVARKVFLFKFFVSQYPGQMSLILVGQILSGLSEGIGIASMVLVLKIIAMDDHSPELGSGVMAEWFGYAEQSGLTESLGLMLILVVSAVSIKAGLDILVKSYVSLIGAKSVADARLQMIDALSNSRWHFFAGKKVGRMSNALNLEAQSYTSILVNICAFFSKLVALAIYLAMSMAFSVGLTLAMIGVGVIIMFVLKGFLGLAEKTGYRLAVLNRSMIARLTDGFQGIKSLKAMGLTSFLVPLLKGEIRSLMRTSFVQGLAKIGLTHVREPLIVLAGAIGVYFSIERGGVDPFSLIAVLFLFQRTSTSIGTLQGTYQTVINYEGAFFSFQELLRSAERAREQSSAGKKSPNLGEGIRFNDMEFGYELKEPTIQNLNVHFRSPALIAIKGVSGSGKTTLLDLICGLHRPGKGDLMVGEDSITEIDLEQWRQRIGYVEQDSILFHESIRVNVGFGNPQVTESVIIDALQSAEVYEFVMSLQDGLDTIVGERGILMSGGQRQRLTLARALAKKPDVLLLDEATTALDPETEAEIVSTLKKLSEDMLIIAVSHQLAISAVADYVYELQQKTLVPIEDLSA